MTNEIQQNRYDRIIRRVAGIIGPGSKVAEVITELFPMFDVEHLPGELFLLGGTVLGMGATTQAGAAGETPGVQLFNPADSGQIGTVTTVVATTTSATTVRIARASVQLANGIGTQVARDTRQNATSLPTLQMFAESSVPLVNANMAFLVDPRSPLIIQDDNDVMVLGPGQGISVGISTAAATLGCTFLWRERPAEPSELSL